MTRDIYTRPEKFRVHWIPAPREIDRDDVRLTIANDDDWDNALDIVEALGPEALEWQRIAGFLSHQPAMRKRMAAMNRAVRRKLTDGLPVALEGPPTKGFVSDGHATDGARRALVGWIPASLQDEGRRSPAGRRAAPTYACAAAHPRAAPGRLQYPV